MLRRIVRIKAWLVVIALILLSMPSAAVAVERCAPQDTMQIEIRVAKDLGRVNFDHSRSQAQLKRMSGAKVDNAWKVNGLTKRTYTTESSARFKMVPMNKGRYYCVRLETVDLKVGLGRIDVFVANKYSRNSCAFRAVMNHEQQHVEINRRVLRRMMGRIDDKVRSAVYNFEPFPARSTGEAQRKLSDYFKRALEPLYRRLDDEANEENARIDTEASYTHLRKQCDRW